ncbi:hypothetical protein U1Q18_043217 [Sarracenia purpurea var. burkii]
MVNDLPLDLRSRNFASAVVKNFEDHVQDASTDLARRVSLEERVYCLIGLSPIQIAEGLKLTFRPLIRAAVPFASGKLSEAQDEKDDGADEENVNGSSGDGEESSTEGSLTEQEVCNATGEVEIIMEAPNNLSQSDLSLAGDEGGGQSQFD